MAQARTSSPALRADADTPKRRAILAAARAVFLRDGYAVSMDRVAAEAGVAKQTVYGYFGSKEALFRAMAASLPRPDREALDAAGDPAAVLRDFGRRLLRRLLDPAAIDMQRLMIAQAAAFPDLARLFHEAGAAQTLARLADYMALLARSGALAPCDPARAAEDFVGLLQGMRRVALLFGARAAPDEAELRRVAQQATGTFLRAYGRMSERPK